MQKSFYHVLKGKTDMPATAIFYPDQNLRQITTDPAPDYHVRWSPDGKMLAFASWRSGEPKIWLIPKEPL